MTPILNLSGRGTLAQHCKVQIREGTIMDMAVRMENWQSSTQEKRRHAATFVISKPIYN